MTVEPTPLGRRPGPDDRGPARGPTARRRRPPRALASPRRVLPKGRNAASREVVWESQHARMLEAVAAAVGERGYAGTAVADVIARAGVSRKTFYEHFANKEECFLAAYDAGADVMLRAIADAVDAASPDWLEAVRAGLECFLGALAENPEFARTFLIEVLAAGPSALERRVAVHARFATQLAEGHRVARGDLPQLPDLPDYVFRAAVGAINELVIAHLVAAEPATLPDLLPRLMHVLLSLYGAQTLEQAAELLGGAGIAQPGRA